MKEERRIKAEGLLLFVVSLLWLRPLLTTVVKSFSAMDGNGGFSLEQYKYILTENPVYLQMFWNSVLLTVSVAAGSVAVSLLGAYGFTMLHFRGKEIIFYFYILVMLLPQQVTLMPNYLVARFLGIEESYLAIILPAIFHPFGVFLLRQQMKMLPEECIEAAKIDGAGHKEIFSYLMFPLVKSGIISLVMLLVIEYWNLVDQAVIFITKIEKYPMSVFLAKISQEAAEISNAASTFYLIPVLALLCYGHEYLKDGIGLLNTGGR